MDDSFRKLWMVEGQQRMLEIYDSVGQEGNLHTLSACHLKSSCKP